MSNINKTCCEQKYCSCLYWEHRNSAVKIWDESGKMDPKRLDNLLKSLNDVHDKIKKYYNSVVYKCTYKLRPNQNVNFSWKRGSYLDTWARGGYDYGYNLEHVEMDPEDFTYYESDCSPDAPTYEEDLVIYLRPSYHYPQPLRFFDRCLHPNCNCEATKIGNFILCEKHSSNQSEYDPKRICQIRINRLENIIKEGEEVLSKDILRPDRVITSHYYDKHDNFSEVEVYIDLVDICTIDIADGNISD